MNDVYGLTPINGTAARVTSQSGCSDALTPKQERESLIDHINQIDVSMLTLHKNSKERKALGIKRLELCKEIGELNAKMKKFSIGVDGRDSFNDCIFAVMKEQLSNFQYKQILKLARKMYQEDLDHKAK